MPATFHYYCHYFLHSYAYCVYTVLFILWPWYCNLFSSPNKVLLLFLVLKEKVLVFVLTKKSWSWSWCCYWKNMKILFMVLILTSRILILVLM